MRFDVPLGRSRALAARDNDRRASPPSALHFSDNPFTDGDTPFRHTVPA
jgi:hypothetical protein